MKVSGREFGTSRILSKVFLVREKVSRKRRKKNTLTTFFLKLN
jgi:hypothetical protein